MKITILGSGTGVPSIARSSCSVLVEIGPNLLLFDAGAGTMRRLMEAGKSIDQISYIFLSHLHPDHSCELAPFLFATKYFWANGTRKPFIIIASAGFKLFLDSLETAYQDWIRLGPEIVTIAELDNMGPDHLSYVLFDVDSLPLAHTDQSLAYRITTGSGLSMVYSGDTDRCDNLIELARDCDLLICESAFPDEMAKAGHLTPSIAGDMATKANVKKLVLTHFYPECDGVDLEAQCRKTYQGPLVLAKDLMTLEL